MFAWNYVSTLLSWRYLMNYARPCGQARALIHALSWWPLRSARWGKTTGASWLKTPIVRSVESQRR